jgi:SAM-dependent methyltransferase
MKSIKTLLTTIGDSDPRPKTYLAKLFHKPRYDELAKILCRLTTGKVNILLDVGCGRGIFYQWLRNTGMRISTYVGCDIDRKRLKEAKSEKVLCDAQHLPFRNRSVDCAVCSEVLEHLKQPLLAFNGMLKASGKWVIVTFPDERIKDALGFKYPEHVAKVRIEELVKHSETLNYTLVFHVRLFFAFPPSLMDKIMTFSPAKARLVSAALKVLSTFLGELCMIKTELLVFVRK